MPMNSTFASMQPTKSSATPAQDAVAAGVSAWMDGDLAFAAFADDDLLSDESTETWHRYHLIGDVLRAGAPAAFVCSDAARDSARAQAFARTILMHAAAVPVTDALAVEAMLDKPVVLGVTKPAAQAVTAANDAVYRWKMVAGFASVAAVAAVAWSVVGMGGASSGEGALLASTAVNKPLTRDASPAPLFAASAPEPIWVTTPQGVVLRDARMEELMRTHRQAGGGPVLQVPAGFLRAATHDVVQR